MKAIQVAQAGSKMQTEFDRDQGLAEQYLAEAKVQELYALYQKRCQQLHDFGETLSSMAQMYAGKVDRGFNHTATPDAVAAMERVAMAAIELAKAVGGKAKP